jgi:quercetin dioxygenase-like cupin family protein
MSEPTRDPTTTDADKYRTVFENDRVRVLEYRDEPGGKTTAHDHPDSVMITLSGFDRRLSVSERERDVRLEAGEIRWLDAQRHAGENIGTTPTHVVFVELKGGGAGAGGGSLGPADGPASPNG